MKKINSLQCNNKTIVICDPKYLSGDKTLEENGVKDYFIVNNLYNTHACDVYDCELNNHLGTFTSGSGQTGVFIIDNYTGELPSSFDAFTIKEFTGDVSYYEEEVSKDKYPLFSFIGTNGDKVIFKSYYSGF